MTSSHDGLKSLKVSVILPALNEGLTVGETIREFHAELPEAEIWIIDNGSNDNTASVAREALSATSASGGVLTEPLRGKGNALRRAFHEIQADIYVLADADLTYPAAFVGTLIEPVLTMQADMVVGDRISTGSYSKTRSRRFHGLGNILVSSLVNALYKSDLRDVMSGYRVFSRRFVKNYPILVSGFQIETDLSLHALDKRFRILEMPIDYQNRPAGSESKLRTVSDGTRVLNTIARIFRLYRPFAFFGSLSAITGVSAFAFGVPVVVDWSITGLVPRFPTALLAASLGLFSLIFLTLGLVLDSISQHERRTYELRLLSWGTKGDY